MSITSTIFLNREVEVSGAAYRDNPKAFACISLCTDGGQVTLHSPTPETLRALASQCRQTASDLETLLGSTEAPKREYVCQRCNGTGRHDLGSDCEACKGDGVEHG